MLSRGRKMEEEVSEGEPIPVEG
eukprot:SAG11_NODE_16542_length_544_cov_1.955056_2_plen_22_part_01